MTMRTFLIVTFIGASLNVFIGALLLGLGNSHEQYIPFFKMGSIGLLASGLLKLYIDYTKRQNKTA